MATNRIGRKTAPGFADPTSAVGMPKTQAQPVAALPEAKPAQQPPAAQPLNADKRAAEAADKRGKSTPMVEVEVSYERGSAPRAEPIRRVFEVWTHNHVYSLDSHLRCVEVRTTHEPKIVRDHPFLGTRLVGGQVQDEQSLEMSYPLPRPGSFAVFEARKGSRRQFSRTSAVVRVVLRLRVVTVTDPTAVPTWEEVSSDS